MTDKVIHLATRGHGPVEFVDKVAHWLGSSVENILDDDWSDEDMELDNPNSDETILGPLTESEKRLYIIGKLLEETMKEEMIELEASNADVLAKIMREKRISMAEASHEFNRNPSNHIKEEDRVFLNKCSVTMAALLTRFEWSVRVRYDEWKDNLIVRRGFIVVAYA